MNYIKIYTEKYGFNLTHENESSVIYHNSKNVLKYDKKNEIINLINNNENIFFKHGDLALALIENIILHRE